MKVDIGKWWLEEYLDPHTGLCSLCGNVGVIDTIGRAISPVGVHSGRMNFCICPNGRAKKKAGQSLFKGEQ